MNHKDKDMINKTETDHERWETHYISVYWLPVLHTPAYGWEIDWLCFKLQSYNHFRLGIQFEMKLKRISLTVHLPYMSVHIGGCFWPQKYYKQLTK